MPEASYDQGAYIGDYSSTTFSPAGLAARLVPLLAEKSFALLPELISPQASLPQLRADLLARPLLAHLAVSPAVAFAPFAQTLSVFASQPQFLTLTASSGWGC